MDKPKDMKLTTVTKIVRDIRPYWSMKETIPSRLIVVFLKTLI